MVFSSNMGVKTENLAVSARMYGQGKEYFTSQGGGHPAYLCRCPCFWSIERLVKGMELPYVGLLKTIENKGLT